MSQVPLGIIHNGPLQTLPTPDGKSVDNDCWFDPDFMSNRRRDTGARSMVRGCSVRSSRERYSSMGSGKRTPPDGILIHNY